MHKSTCQLRVEEMEPRTLLTAAPLTAPVAEAAVVAHAARASAPVLLGTVHGHYALRHGHSDAAAYVLQGAGTVGGLGHVVVTGSLSAGGTGGRLSLANPKGTVTLALHGSAAGQFGYRIVKASGAYRRLAGTGVIDLNLDTAAHFALDVHPGTSPVAVPAPLPPALKSGIAGVAMEGPLRPIEQPGVPNSRPLPGAIISVQPAGGGPEVARVVADDKGRFQLALAPGTYRVLALPPDPGQLLPRGIPQDVTVGPGQVVQLTLMLDTGIV